MAMGSTHYLPNGRIYTGPTHKMNGQLHTGVQHSSASQVLTHSKPKIATRFSRETPKNAKLPERVKRKRKRSSIMTALEEGARRLGR